MLIRNVFMEYYGNLCLFYKILSQKTRGLRLLAHNITEYKFNIPAWLDTHGIMTNKIMTDKKYGIKIFWERIIAPTISLIKNAICSRHYYDNANII